LIALIVANSSYSMLLLVARMLT